MLDDNLLWMGAGVDRIVLLVAFITTAADRALVIIFAMYQRFLRMWKD